MKCIYGHEITDYCKICMTESGIHRPACKEIIYSNYFRGNRWRWRSGTYDLTGITVADNMKWLFGSTTC